jgi:hypothetical protein
MTRQNLVHPGRTPKVDWSGTIRPYVFKLLDELGDLMVGDPKWSSQGDLERAVHDHICHKLGVDIGESTVREYVSDYLKEWRATKDQG